MKKFLAFIFVSGLTIGAVCSQQVVSSSGASFTNASGSLSYTIGEPVIATLTTSDAILTQGFHQTRLKVTGIGDAGLPGVEVSAFPNPVREMIRLKVTAPGMNNLKYSLYDMQGKVIREAELKGPETEISFSSLKAATYFLKVHSAGKELRVLKIVKE